MTDKPAFPISWDGRQGMTLREWYAGQALIGYLSAQPHGDEWPEVARLAKWCFDTADAILAKSQEAQS